MWIVINSAFVFSPCVELILIISSRHVPSVSKINWEIEPVSYCCASIDVHDKLHILLCDRQIPLKIMESTAKIKM